MDQSNSLFKKAIPSSAYAASRLLVARAFWACVHMKLEQIRDGDELQFFKLQYTTHVCMETFSDMHAKFPLFNDMT